MESHSEDWVLQAATLPVASPRTIMRKPFGTLDGYSGMPRQVRG
jgi:hypothetical protein